jgi:pimeloyl-ACP methyl ester carboxylesterase
MTLKFAKTSVLRVAYEEHGPAGFPCVILLHGFPYSPRGYDEVATTLAAAGYRVVVPYLRGYGETRFLGAATMRSGQQGALGRDLVELMDALGIEKAGLVGYDWGGRAACIVAALWPHRVTALVTGQGYNIQDIAAAISPLLPEAEYKLWYQYYFQSPRGEAGLAANRYDLCRLLWRLWSPSWAFGEDVYAQSAAAFANPDFVAVVIHSYRHRFGYAAGDAAYDGIEAALAAQPAITVPTIALWGKTDGVRDTPAADPHAGKFKGWYERRQLDNVGHNIPHEAPAETIRAITDALAPA